MINSFYYQDSQDHVYNEQGEKVFNPMEGTLTQITDPNTVLETVTTQKTYLSTPKLSPKNQLSSLKLET